MEASVERKSIISNQVKTGAFVRLVICGYFLLAFFEPYLNGTIGSLSKYYILFLVCVVLLKYRSISLQRFHLCFFTWLILKIASMLYTTNLYIPELHMFSQIGMVGLLIVLTAVPLDGKTIKGIINTMWLGSATIGVLSIFFSHPYHGNVSNRQVLYLLGQEADPNNQAAFLLIGVAIALYNLFFKKRQWLLSLATLAVNAYGLFLTGSRGGFVAFVCIGIFVILFAAKTKSIGKRIEIIIAGALVVAAVYYIARRFIPQEIFDRLFSFSSYEGGSERDVIWENGWNLFTSDFHFLFGAGWGAYYGYRGSYVVMHNTFLSMLCDVGIFGFALFFLPILKKSIWLVRHRINLPVLLLICGMVPSFFIEAINKRFFWNVIILLFIYARWATHSEGRDVLKNENLVG